MKIMAKIKELLAGRERLAKYDELTEWKRMFENDKPQIERGIYHVESSRVQCGTTTFDIPDHIKQIIVAALDAEIKKLDEE